jgi:prepilin-type N-terminal cleavage/methylation domain-containing protein
MPVITNQEVKTMCQLNIRRHRGFTLVELLVVIAIIAILAAILFPFILKAKEKGRETTCNNQLRQLAVAFQMYTDAWYGAFPDQTSVGIPYTGGRANAHIGAMWIKEFAHRYKTDDGLYPAGIGLVLRPYLKNLQIFKCPSEWKKWDQEAIAAEPGYLPYEVRSSYYVKHALMQYADYYARPVKISDVKFPSKAALVYEQAWHNYGWRPFLWDVYYWQRQPNRPWAMRVNCVFIDCHAGSFMLPYTSSCGYDGNWYVYQKDATQWGRYWDLAAGARDLP